MLPDLHIGFSRGRSGGLVFPSLSEFSTVCCDPHSQRLGIVNKAEIRDMQIKAIMRFTTIKIFNYHENKSLISLALFISRKIFENKRIFGFYSSWLVQVWISCLRLWVRLEAFKRHFVGSLNQIHFTICLNFYDNSKSPLIIIAEGKRTLTFFNQCYIYE